MVTLQMQSKPHNVSAFFSDDTKFDKLFPRSIQTKAAVHWTPLEVAQCAGDFLVPHNGARVLDVGSGIGKFCFAGAYHNPHASFYGVEQRKTLVTHAVEITNRLGLPNVSFVHGSFTQVDFREFDSFYFFNSFYENLKGSQKIDDSVEHSVSLYDYYSRYLFRQLEYKPTGTRIATYHSTEDEMPPCYYVVKTAFNGLLKFWVKV